MRVTATGPASGAGAADDSGAGAADDSGAGAADDSGAGAEDDSVVLELPPQAARPSARTPADATKARRRFLIEARAMEELL